MSKETSGSEWPKQQPRRLVAVLLVAVLCFSCHGLFVLFASDLITSQADVDVDLPFAIVDIVGKGKGMVATRDIMQGESILREEPMFILPSGIPDENVTLYDIVHQLDRAKRALFYTFAHSNFAQDLVPRENPARFTAAIFWTNAAEVTNGSALFPTFLRINHACARSFNVVYYWREDEGVLVVNALKDIKKGEELTTSYIEPKLTRDERRATLSSCYGFTCQCDVCSLPDDESQASDARLTAVATLEEQVLSWFQHQIDGQETMELVRRIWKITEEEGYWYGRGEFAEVATVISVAHSDELAAVEWANLAVKWLGIQLGNDTDRVDQMHGTALDPHSHPLWGYKDPMTVGGPGLHGPSTCESCPTD